MDPQITSFLTILDNPFYASMFLLLSLWGLAWKGVTLWKSARNNQKKWFLALLLVNTFGILEIIYLFYFQKNKEFPKNPL